MTGSMRFTEGPIYRPLIRFSFPVFLALFLQAAYGAVDMLVIGRFGDASDVSAVSLGAMVMQTVTFVLSDIAMGSTVLIARNIGEGKDTEVGWVIGATITLFVVLGMLAMAVMEPFSGVVIRILRTPVPAQAKATAYVRICSAGMLLIVAYNVLGAVFRGMGNSRLPLFSVALATACNIAGDLLLVGVLGMGVAGAAIATVLSQGVSVAVSLAFCRGKRFPFPFSRKHIRWNRSLCGAIFRIGLPLSFQDLLVSLSFLVIAAIINRMGLTASAGVGIAEKVCGFLMLVPSSFMQAMSAFVAQNVGSGRTERADKALWYGMLTSLAVGVCMFVLAFFHGVRLSLLFTTDTAVAAASGDYLKAYGIDCIFTSFLFCFLGYFNGRGWTKFVMVQGIVGSFGVRIPLSFVFSGLAGASLFTVGLATPSSSFVQILLCMGRFFAGRRHS